MEKKAGTDLTYAPETLYPDDDDSRMRVPPEATSELASTLAKRTGLPADQVALVLSELAVVAQAQVSSHPNRYFVIPGIVALRDVRKPGQKRVNPFTKEVTEAGSSSELKVKFPEEMREAVRAAFFSRDTK